MATSNYPFNPIGRWKENRLMKPSEFQRERKIGEIDVVLPEPPRDITKILNHDKPIKEQKWKKIPPPDFRTLSSEEQKAYLIEEVKRRNNGVFIYISGGIEYLTGIHYWMLQNWIIDGKPMAFRDSQRDFFYAWDACVVDTDCFGLAYYTNRRDGKTESGMGIVYEYVSKTHDSHGGIQSKTNTDAGNIFRKLIARWKRIPDFWKPVDSGETNPKKSLRFEEPGVRSTKNQKKTYKDVLNSIITYMPSVEEAYDGYKLQRYYDDEFGKFVEGDAYERWDIVKPCLVEGTTIIGKSIHTTMVEELERKGGKAALLIWNDSDPKERKADGRTRSGLYRLFKPAYYGLEGFIDEYGFSKIDEAKEALLKQRDGLTGEKLAAEQRKFPFTPYEAFMSASSGGIFPAHKINEQKVYNETLPSGVYRVGNFIWVDDHKTNVDFFDDPNGKWKVAWMPPQDRRNLFEVTPAGMKPLNIGMGGIGSDPFDNNKVAYGSGSNGAIYVFRSLDPTEPLRSNCFVCEYVARPDRADIFYDDVIKTCVFYGMKVLAENNKPGLVNHIEKSKYKPYLERIRKDEFTKSTSRNWEYGIPMSGEGAREALVNGLTLYISKFIGSISEHTQISDYGFQEDKTVPSLHGFCPFEHLLNDWSNFDIMKWTDYDATVASGLAIMMSKRKRVIIEENGEENTIFFPTYSLSSRRR